MSDEVEGTRPKKLTLEALTALVSAFGQGLTQDTAGGIVGVTGRTVRNWLSIGRALLEADHGDEEVAHDEEPITEHQRRCMVLAQGWESSRANMVRMCTAVILRSAVGIRDEQSGEYLIKPNPHMAELVLRRMDPQTWGDRIAHTDNQGGPLVQPDDKASRFATAAGVTIEFVSNGREENE